MPDYGRNDWLRQHADDVIFHRQLMAEDLTMENAADLLTAQREEDGEIVGLRIETKRDAVNISTQQVAGLLETLALARHTTVTTTTASPRTTGMLGSKGSTTTSRTSTASP